MYEIRTSFSYSERLAHLSFFVCLQMLSQMVMLWNGHSSRMDLARQYPEVIFSCIYVLFDGTW